MSGLFVKQLSDEQVAFVREWVGVLRTGTYKQAQDRLRNGDRFCCLGVACDLAIKTGRTNGVWTHEDWFRTGRGKIAAEGTLPRGIRIKLGLRGDAGDFTDDKGKPHSLADLNDSGATFRKIANRIDRELTAALAAREPK